MSDTMLPPGVHPHDRRESETDWQGPAPEHPAGGPPRGKAPFRTSPGQAMGVFQRAATNWTCGTIRVHSGQSQATRVVGRRAGRTHITLWVPTKALVGGTLVTVAAGVTIATTTGDALNDAGIALNVGDSITLPTEASVYVSNLPGEDTGIVQWAEFYNPETAAPGT